MTERMARAIHWQSCTAPLCGARLGLTKRTQVLPAHAAGVQGECIGVSQNAKRSVYCSSATSANGALMELIKGSLLAHLRDFAFSTVQLNMGLRPKIILHRDAASVGGFLTISLGPFVGGLLWQATLQKPEDFANHVAFYPPWTCNVVSGSHLHSSTPHHGQRCSIVLFTHEACLLPLPQDAQCNACALQLATTTDVSPQQFAAEDHMGVGSCPRVAFQECP